MRSIERTFKNIQKKNPFYSSWTCFAETVKNRNYTKRTINFWFNRLVDTEDYRREERKELLSFLYDCTNTPEDCTK